ncbi:MAG: hypothetical protein O3B95_04555 [Chloroflexi bacterium]|nr:hypothetical protein [Chloroflexota bacterium]
MKAPKSITLNVGEKLGIAATSYNDLGAANNNLDSVSWFWSVGACGALSSTSVRNPVFTGSGAACTGTLTVHATQGGGGAVPSSGRVVNVTVLALPQSGPAEPSSVDPSTPLNFPGTIGTGWANVPPSGTTVQGPSGSGASILFPPLAIPNVTQVGARILVVAPGNVPPPPTRPTEGSNGGFILGPAIDIQFVGSDLVPIPGHFTTNKPTTICAPVPAEFFTSSWGGPDGIGMARYDATTGWTELNSFVTGINVCGRTVSHSIFAVTSALQPPDTMTSGGPSLPITGDTTPGMGALIAALFAGLALVATGLFTARRASKVRSNS